MAESTNPVELVAPGVRDIVGESPLWDDRNETLYWVDIIGRSIRAFDTTNCHLRSYATEDFPTAIGLCAQPGRLIVALAGGVQFIDLESGLLTHFAKIRGELPDNRLNEGAVGPDGAFWVGTMQTNLNADGTMRPMDRRTGAFYRVRADGSVARISEATFGITNTLAWDEARGRMYLGDTQEKAIYSLAWPLNLKMLQKPSIHNKTDALGFPDGSCLDEDGYLWNARYAGGCLLRIAPSGEVAATIQLPATNVTACCFGGPDLATLFVTTATNELSTAQLQSPSEGAVLAFQPGVRGRAAYRFGDELPTRSRP